MHTIQILCKNTVIIFTVVHSVVLCVFNSKLFLESRFAALPTSPFLTYKCRDSFVLLLNIAAATRYDLLGIR